MWIYNVYDDVHLAPPIQSGSFDGFQGDLNGMNLSFIKYDEKKLEEVVVQPQKEDATNMINTFYEVRSTFV